MVANVDSGALEREFWVVATSITRRKLSSFNAGYIMRLMMGFVMNHMVDARFQNNIAGFIGHRISLLSSLIRMPLEYAHAR